MVANNPYRVYARVFTRFAHRARRQEDAA